MMEDPTRIQRSRMLSLWLRHKPERGGLTLTKEGWAAIPDILEAFDRAGQIMTRAELEHLIRLDPKGRFEMEGDRVRARYGHSLELQQKPHPGKPPATLYHGTPSRFLPRILEAGLRPMKRQYVHLSPDRKTAREVGRRRDQEPAILAVDAHRACEAGVQFYPRGLGIWLSDPIPPQFLRLLEGPGAPDANPSQTSRAARESAPGEPRRRRPRGGFMKRGR